ncbi:hypothetical protein IE81DRAFT_341431 [Ceraceosorus guamensis]|uniref:Serine/threonine-protein kinase Tel1 n=1 Tax=Ceraceosorus guamensis TaxID=1522189 RepID=A0A316W431_9BASI|nr:hypothetical protein IE81DRAFT_341431 [Ceraceosorus guamensis]PWN42375.1 hypothetical protein IE81DRAFT_341431 [Ceraceosorus guamensis]
MSQTGLQEALRLLTSDKIKGREEGQTAIRAIFGKRSVCARFDEEDPDRQRWVRVIEALFACAALDKAACMKRGDWQDAPQVAINRVKHSAQTARWLIEQAIAEFRLPAVFAVLQQTFRLLEQRGQPFQPVLLECLQAMGAALSYAPHIDHFDEARWSDTAGLLCNILFKDRLSAKLEQHQEADIRLDGAPQPSPSDGEDGDAAPSAQGLATSDRRKRPRSASAANASSQKNVAGPEDVEVMKAIQKLIESTTAPLCTDAKLGLRLLSKYARFLQTFRTDSTAHLPAMIGLNALLNKLQYNERITVARFAFWSWPSLLAMWPTKNRPLKEQLVVCLRTLLPIVARALACPGPRAAGLASSTQSAADVAEQGQRAKCLAQVFELVQTECDHRWAIPPLTLANVDLAHQPGAPCAGLEAEHVLLAGTIRPGRGFTAPHALSWAMLELAADAAICIQALGYSSTRSDLVQSANDIESGDAQEVSAISRFRSAPHGQGSHAASTPTFTSRTTSVLLSKGGTIRHDAKRRRLEDSAMATWTPQSAVGTLIGRLCKAASLLEPAKRIWYLQIILFVNARHWKQLDPDERRAVLEYLLGHASGDDIDVQCWSLVAFAAAARNSASSRTVAEASIWSSIWPLACRRMTMPGAARAGAHAALAILQAGLLEPSIIHPQIETLLGSIDLQGPNQVSDAVCAFLCECLCRCRATPGIDARTMEQKCATWLMATWSPSEAVSRRSKTNIRAEEQGAVDLANLMANICRLSRWPTLARVRPLLPSCAVITQNLDNAENASLGAFLLQCDVSDPEVASDSAQLADVEFEEGVPSREPEPIGQRLLAFVDRNLQIFLDEWSDASDSTGKVRLKAHGTVEQVRRTVDFATAALLFDAILRANHVESSRTLSSAASSLLASAIGAAADQRWAPSARLTILKGLEPLLPCRPVVRSDSTLDKWSALVRPGAHSGAQRKLTNDSLSKPPDVPSAVFHARLWRQISCQEVILETLRSVLGRVAKPTESLRSVGTQAVAAEDDGVWSNIRSADDGQRSENASAVEDLTNRLTIELCIGTLCDVPMLRLPQTPCQRSGEGVLREEDVATSSFGPGNTQPQATSDDTISQLLVEGPISFLQLALGTACRLFEQHRLHFTRSTLNTIIVRLGDDMLLLYEHEQSEQAQLLAINLLDRTLSAWSHPSASQSELQRNAEKLAGYFAKRFSKRHMLTALVRLRSGVFVERMLRCMSGADRIVSKTLVAPIKWRPERPADLKAQSLLHSLLRSVVDKDAGVRFAAASRVGRLVDICASGKILNLEALYEELRSLLPDDVSDAELMMTRVLTLGNVLISNGPVRYLAIYHLLELSLVSTQYHEILATVFEAVALRLGFASARDLWLHFCPSSTWFLIQGGYDPLRLPYNVLGYTSRKHCVEGTFRPVASILLAAEQDHHLEAFTTLTSFTRKSTDTAMKECLPFLAAIEAGSLGEESAFSQTRPDYKQQRKTLQARLASRWHLPPARFHEISAMLSETANLVVVALLQNLYDSTDRDRRSDATSLDTIPGVGRGLGIVLTALEGGNPQSAMVLRALLRPIDAHEAPDLDSYLPARPFYSAAAVYHGLQILADGEDELVSAATAYHVVRRLFGAIASGCLINDQHRHLFALKLYIAIASPSIIEDNVVLCCIIQGALGLLQALDLSDQTLSLLDWSLRRVLHLSPTSPRLAPLLTALLHTAESLDVSGEENKRSLSTRILSWLGRVLQESTDHQAQSTISLVLLAWPAELPAPLAAQMEGKMSITDFASATCQLPANAMNAYFIRRLEPALAAASEDARNEFQAGAIWRLLAPSAADDNIVKRGERAHALARILYLCQNQLRSPSANHNGAELSAALPAYALSEDLCADLLGPLKSAILAVLLDSLNKVESVSTVDTLLRPLCAILSSEPALREAHVRTDSASLHEFNLLSAFASEMHVPRRRSIVELELWSIDCSSDDYEIWASRFALLLCDVLSLLQPVSFFGQIAPVLRHNWQMAGTLLPALLHATLETEQLAQDLSEIQGSSATISKHFTALLERPECDRRIWKAVIEMVIHLRKYVRGDSPIGDQWLQIDFLLLARCASDVRRFASAMLFVELAKEYTRPDGGEEDFNSSDPKVLELLYQICESIEDPDSFYAIRDNDLRRALVGRLHHEKRWGRAFEMHAASLESASDALFRRGLGSDTAHLNLTLHEMGFNRLSSLLDRDVANLTSGGEGSNEPCSFQSTSAKVQGDVRDITYDVAWRAGNWDLPLGDRSLLGSDRNVYAALRGLHQNRSAFTSKRALLNTLSDELSAFNTIGPEANTLARRIGRNLMSLGEVAQWQGLLSGNATATPFVNANPEHSSDFLEFDDFERLLSIRVALIRLERSYSRRDDIGEGIRTGVDVDLSAREIGILMRLSQGARDHVLPQTAMRSVLAAQELHNDVAVDAPVASVRAKNFTSAGALTEELASVLWTQGEHTMAIQALEHVLPRHVSNNNKEMVEAALRRSRLGRWRATARSDQPRRIDSDYFQVAWELVLDGRGTAADRAQVAHDYATFADEQCHSTSVNEEVCKLERFVKDRRAEIDSIETAMGEEADVGRKKKMGRQRGEAKKLLKIDEAQLVQHVNARKAFRDRAANMFAVSLTDSDSFDGDVIKLTSLWFEHADDEAFNGRLRDSILAIPSQKFVLLMHQISSRLSKTGSSARNTPLSASSATSETFASTLFAVTRKMALEHPFHCLYALYALRKGAELEKSSARRGELNLAQLAASPQQLRGAAAEDIIHQARNNPKLKGRLTAWQKVCDACVEWAEISLPHTYPSLYPKGRVEPGGRILPSEPPLKLRRIRDVPVPVMTCRLALDPTCKYEHFVSIARFSERFSTAGGIHNPKITECLGSDGQRYKQLFKTEDDLRQDAVMQQVFVLVNGLLQRDKAARKRRLHVRTYAVIPLGPQCGLLEFVADTEPIGTQLMDAHNRHATPGSLTPMEARVAMHNAQGGTYDERVDTYLQVCERFPPAFRFYFFDRYHVPLTWLETRLNYTRSVAVSSIVGHMLGIGDRHVSNILLDTHSGEVIHIDFGVAFEQGRLLPIPELVPFRLTRDVIDGMGLSGTEGVFRRCCEETLRVLREGANVVQTVLEVFKYDPLWAWSSNPVKVLKAQAGGEDFYANAPRVGTSGVRGAALSSTNSGLGTSEPGRGERGTAELLAERAISSVMAKLSPNLSVEYTVNDLIQQATIPEHLGVIFHGWQPAL